MPAWGSLREKEYYICGKSETERKRAAQMPSKRVKLALIMLAAGNSRRFGSNKLMYEVDGVPMYQRTLRLHSESSRKNTGQPDRGGNTAAVFGDYRYSKRDWRRSFV